MAHTARFRETKANVKEEISVENKVCVNQILVLTPAEVEGAHRCGACRAQGFLQKVSAGRGHVRAAGMESR